ncbi:MAG: hypothetical protein ACI9KE_006127 [Polyangiales bacterium]|jgi:hypothetical protein
MFALLAGAALSFGAARHQGGCHSHHDRRAAFEARVARVCVDAAREATEGDSPEAESSKAPFGPRFEEQERFGDGPFGNGPPGYSPSR